MSVVLNLSDEEAEQLVADMDGIMQTSAESPMDEERRSILEKTRAGLSDTRGHNDQ